MHYLPYSTQDINQEDIDGVIEVLQSPFLTQGKKVEEFELSLCTYTGAKYAVAFNSATSALLGAYNVAGITKGDEIITTPISFVATSNMFVDLGAIPIWCDVAQDGNINVDLIEALITPKTKAIVPVHFSGKPVNIKKIHALADKYNLLVIEDAAHALGSSIDGQKIGSFSSMSVFSFHAIKPITTAEGGAVLTDNKEYANALRLFRSHGILKKELYKSDMVSMGYNLRMSEIAASMGVTQMKRLSSFIAMRNSIASYYDSIFKHEQLFRITLIEDSLISARHLYPILLHDSLLQFKEDIFKELQEMSIGVQVHYKPIYQNTFYIQKFKEVFLEGAQNYYNAEISIPCHQKMNLEEAEYVANSLLKIVKKYAQKLDDED